MHNFAWGILVVYGLNTFSALTVYVVRTYFVKAHVFVFVYIWIEDWNGQNEHFYEKNVNFFPNVGIEHIQK